MNASMAQQLHITCAGSSRIIAGEIAVIADIRRLELETAIQRSWLIEAAGLYIRRKIISRDLSDWPS